VKLSVIVNPASGGGRGGRAARAVGEALRALDLEHEISPTRDLGHARELARRAAARGQAAVALGGDGLVGAVAGALRDSGGVLGVLPGGRGNDFARCLGIPLDPVRACQVLATGVTRALDLGQAGDGTFIGIASCGLDSEANRIANATRLVRGNLVYTYGGLRALLGWRAASFTMRLDGIAHALRGYTVALANAAAYGGGMLLAPDARMDDGLLDVVLIEDGSKLSFLRSLPKVFSGAHVELESVTILRAREIEVHADRPFAMYADGDPIAQLPVTVRVLPAAINVIAPIGARLDAERRVLAAT
jgi:YegS/Rv2252/BmrU family lipid kinase